MQLSCRPASRTSSSMLATGARPRSSTVVGVELAQEIHRAALQGPGQLPGGPTVGRVVVAKSFAATRPSRSCRSVGPATWPGGSSRLEQIATAPPSSTSGSAAASARPMFAQVCACGPPVTVAITRLARCGLRSDHARDTALGSSLGHRLRLAGHDLGHRLAAARARPASPSARRSASRLRRSSLRLAASRWRPTRAATASDTGRSFPRRKTAETNCRRRRRRDVRAGAQPIGSTTSASKIAAIHQQRLAALASTPTRHRFVLIVRIVDDELRIASLEPSSSVAAEFGRIRSSVVTIEIASRLDRRRFVQRLDRSADDAADARAPPHRRQSPRGRPARCPAASGGNSSGVGQRRDAAAAGSATSTAVSRRCRSPQRESSTSCVKRARARPAASEMRRRDRARAGGVS